MRLYPFGVDVKKFAEVIDKCAEICYIVYSLLQCSCNIQNNIGETDQ